MKLQESPTEHTQSQTLLHLITISVTTGIN